MKIKSFLILVCYVTLYSLFSCNEIEKYPLETEPIQFISSVAGEEADPLTRAVGDSWSANDAIGIFMKKTGTELTRANILNNADNIKYITPSGNKYFTPAENSQAIHYPKNENVDFIAYYPYREMLDNYIYLIDLTDQSAQEEIDFMYSGNAVNLSTQASTGTNISFSHRLTKLKFSITTNDYISTLEGLTVTISGSCTSGTFNLATGQLTVNGTSKQDIDAYTVINGAAATSEAIIFPIISNNEVEISFHLSGGKTFKHQFPSTTIFASGASYTYNIVLKGNDGSVEQNYGYFETPVKTSIDNTIFVLHHLPAREGRNYSMLYDTKYRLAYWVAYPLNSYYLGSQSKTDAWQYDSNIPQNNQPYLKNSFAPGDLERGLQLPSADRTYNYAENSTTFYYSNITAQNSTLNRGEWERLEAKVRTWVQNCDTLYVVTGAMITTKTDTTIDLIQDNNGNDVARPKYYYKALAQKIGNDYFTLAYKMYNEQPANGFESYRLTVADLERETGFTFFPGVSAEVKEKIQADRWN